MSPLRRIATASVLALVAATGCANMISPKTPAGDASGEWVSGRVELRKVTAVVRVTPPARLKAAFETVAARTDDEDLADFLRAQASGGFGSGFLMVHRSAEGTAAFVVTNRHVIAEAEEAEVTFGDGTTYKSCKVAFSSPKHDLAVLALPESAIHALGPGLRPAAREASDLMHVVAAGYPGVAGRPSYQVTDGKISNAKFAIPELGMEPMLQHTAPIDPGSSGGPLTDDSGALVGVNVMLIRQRASMFFAIPSSAVVETVREAHALENKKRSAAWMTAELDKACATLSAELASASASPERIRPFISNAFVADRGLESYGLLSQTALGPQVRRRFYEDPIAAMRSSVLVRLSIRSSLGGGATGTCASVNAGDAASIVDGKPVRLAVNTKRGPMELTWTFEHGSWRVADGDLVSSSALLEPEEPSGDEAPPKPALAKKRTKPAAKVAAKGGK